MPSVIGARGAAKSGANATPPVRNAGKVFGERANKGAAAAKPVPKRLGGILKQHGITEKSANARPWTRTPKKRRTDNAFQGKVIGARQEPADPAEAAIDKALRRREDETNRKALATWRTNRDALPEHELTAGLNRTVVPDIIESPTRDHRVRRKDIGPVFGRGGWEN
ncbi:MAG: hypothetical protein ACRD0P_10645 [Stackebrandtia sp.]